MAGQIFLETCEKIGMPSITVDSKRKSPVSGCGQVAQLVIGVDDRALVGGDGVRAMFERGAQMIDCWLSAFDVQRRSPRIRRIGPRDPQPLANVAAAAYRRKESRRADRSVHWVSRPRIDPSASAIQPSPPRGHARDPPTNAAGTQLLRRDPQASAPAPGSRCRSPADTDCRNRDELFSEPV